MKTCLFTVIAIGAIFPALRGSAEIYVYQSTSVSQANLIENGGFEGSSLSPWFQGGNYSSPSENPENWNVTTMQAHSGLYSATDVGDIELRQNFSPVPTSQIQDISLWVMQPYGPAISSVYFHYSDAPDQFNRLQTDTTGWEFFDLTSNLAANKHLNGISFFGYSYGSPSGRTFLDDVSVMVVPEPPTVAIGSFAIVAALCRLRCGRYGSA